MWDRLCQSLRGGSGIRLVDAQSHGERFLVPAPQTREVQACQSPHQHGLCHPRGMLLQNQDILSPAHSPSPARLPSWEAWSRTPCLLLSVKGQNRKKAVKQGTWVRKKEPELLSIAHEGNLL